MTINKKRTLPYWLLPFLIIMATASCQKRFLDAPSSESLAIPESVTDFQSILDNTNLFISNNPGLADLCADNYYMDLNLFQSTYYIAQNCYIWPSDTWQGGTGTQVADWNGAYTNIFTANTVLDNLSITPPTASTRSTWNFVKGQALFFRAFNYYNLAQIWGEPYNPASAGTDPGLPLKLSSNTNVTVARSTVKATYDQIISDLVHAKELMAGVQRDGAHTNRPSHPACLALLARTYLMMQDYINAGLYADSCLQEYNALLDYNTIHSTSKAPFPKPVNEVLIQADQGNYGNIGFIAKGTHPDSLLYNSFAGTDLRKSLYFLINAATNLPYLRGGYTNSLYLFLGLATDEVYLTRAECYARNGNKDAAINDLDSILIKRYQTGTFIPLTASSPTDALNIVLAERRKELCYRGLRWTDLRRLNQDPNYAVTLTRVVGGVTYTLPPNDPRYTLLIPLDEVQLSGVAQTPR